MTRSGPTPTTRTDEGLEQQPVPVRARLAAAWTSFMFLYIYVDYLNLYVPGVMGDIQNGVVWKLDISQAFVVSALALVAIPIVMVALSTTLPARANRVANIVVASIYVPVSLFNLVDESWTVFFGLGAALEVILLASIIRTAWRWPRTHAGAIDAATVDRLRQPAHA